VTTEAYLLDLEKAATRLGEKLATAQGRHDEVEAMLTDARKNLCLSTEEIDLLEQVTSMLQGLEAAWQKTFQDSVARIISRGLSLVFDEPIELKMVPKVRADVTTVDFRIIQGEGKHQIETGIMGAKGGTLVAVVNILIRSLLVLSARPPLRRILLLDEPFGLADPQYIPAFGGLLREMCDKLGFQTIIIPHESALVEVSDYAYEVYKKKWEAAGFRLYQRGSEVRA